MCECYQIGGRFIAEDPDCPIHGSEAQYRQREEDDRYNELASRIGRLEQTVESLVRIADATCNALTRITNGTDSAI